MPGREITIAYKLTRSDLFLFQARAVLHNRIFLGIAFLGPAFVVFSTFNVAKSDNTHPVGTTGAIFVAAFAGIITLLAGGLLAAILLVLMIWTAKHKGLLDESTMTIAEDGIHVRSFTGESLRKWAAIHRLVSTRRHLVIFWNETSASVIPKRCFRSPAEAVEFEQEIRSHWQAV